MNTSSQQCDAAPYLSRDEIMALGRAERRQVESHMQALTAERGEPVHFEEAASDWLHNHAQQWREDRMRSMLALQREEIARYKWIRSEEAHRDLGGSAALEWINKYAADWRSWYEHIYDSNDEEPSPSH